MKVVKVLSLVNLQSSKFILQVNTLIKNSVETFDSKILSIFKTWEAEYFSHESSINPTVSPIAGDNVLYQSYF
jgi:hypothetical protein